MRYPAYKTFNDFTSDTNDGDHFSNRWAKYNAFNEMLRRERPELINTAHDIILTLPGMAPTRLPPTQESLKADYVFHLILAKLINDPDYLKAAREFYIWGLEGAQGAPKIESLERARAIETAILKIVGRNEFRELGLEFQSDQVRR